MSSKTKIIFSLLTAGFIAATNAADIEMNLNSSSTFPGDLSDPSDVGVEKVASHF